MAFRHYVHTRLLLPKYGSLSVFQLIFTLFFLPKLPSTTLALLFFLRDLYVPEIFHFSVSSLLFPSFRTLVFLPLSITLPSRNPPLCHTDFLPLSPSLSGHSSAVTHSRCQPRVYGLHAAGAHERTSVTFRGRCTPVSPLTLA